MKKIGLFLALLANLAHAQTYNLFKPATGVLKGNTATYVTTAAAAGDIFALWSGTCNSTTFLRGDGACATSGPSGANPTGTVGLAAVNGSAATFLRSDGAPALSQAITPTWTALHTWTLTQSSNASLDAVALADTTAATSGNQQFSPRLRLTGQGWKTTATAASQSVDWIMETQPVQGSTNPTANLVFSSQTNGGGYNVGATLTNDGGTSVAQWLMPSGAAGTPSYSFSANTNTGFYNNAGTVAIVTGGTQRALFGGTNQLNANTLVGGYITSGGTKFTIASGTGACATTSTTVGGAIAGHFTCTGSTGASTVTLTMGTAVSNAYICGGRDITNATTVTQTGALSTTAVTLTLTSVTANDVIQFSCPMSY